MPHEDINGQISGETMNPRTLRTFALGTIVLVTVLDAPWRAQAQDFKTPYPNMAPLDQYLMERDAEIALARSAAPDSVSRNADVMVLAGC
jgi:hypothetical protein